MSGPHTDTAGSSLTAVPQGDCASARACGHSAPGASAPGVLSAHRQKVTLEDVERIRAMRADGMGWGAIAAATGRTLNAINHMRERYGMSQCAPNAWTRKRRDQLISLKKAGLTEAEIGEAMGITPKAVRSRWTVERFVFGIKVSRTKRDPSALPPPPPPPFVWSPVLDESLLDMRADGVSWKEISAELGATVGQCKARHSTLGIRAAKPNVNEKHRRCLCGCGTTFLSSHAGERISPDCRRSWGDR